MPRDAELSFSDVRFATVDPVIEKTSEAILKSHLLDVSAKGDTELTSAPETFLVAFFVAM